MPPRGGYPYRFPKLHWELSLGFGVPTGSDVGEPETKGLMNVGKPISTVDHGLLKYRIHFANWERRSEQ